MELKNAAAKELGEARDKLIIAGKEVLCCRPLLPCPPAHQLPPVVECDHPSVLPSLASSRRGTGSGGAASSRRSSGAGADEGARD